MFTKIPNIFSRVLNIQKINKINISDLTTSQTISYDEFNKVKNGQYKTIYFHNEKEIGYIEYRVYSGEIYLLRLNKDYRRQNIGKYMLDKAIQDIKINNIPEVWTVTLNYNPFWSNVYNSSFVPRYPVHNSKYAPGYYMKL